MCLVLWTVAFPVSSTTDNTDRPAWPCRPRLRDGTRIESVLSVLSVVGSIPCCPWLGAHCTRAIENRADVVGFEGFLGEELVGHEADGFAVLFDDLPGAIVAVHDHPADL